MVKFHAKVHRKRLGEECPTCQGPADGRDRMASELCGQGCDNGCDSCRIHEEAV